MRNPNIAVIIDGPCGRVAALASVSYIWLKPHDIKLEPDAERCAPTFGHGAWLVQSLHAQSFKQCSKQNSSLNCN